MGMMIPFLVTVSLVSIVDDGKLRPCPRIRGLPHWSEPFGIASPFFVYAKLADIGAMAVNKRTGTDHTFDRGTRPGCCLLSWKTQHGNPSVNHPRRYPPELLCLSRGAVRGGAQRKTPICNNID